ncbi:MAG: hypothetical protein PVI23_05705 [Maricaulaceae bacterium]|jgi:hypothetical protein
MAVLSDKPKPAPKADDAEQDGEESRTADPNAEASPPSGETVDHAILPRAGLPEFEEQPDTAPMSDEVRRILEASASPSGGPKRDRAVLPRVEPPTYRPSTSIGDAAMLPEVSMPRVPTLQPNFGGATSSPQTRSSRARSSRTRTSGEGGVGLVFRLRFLLKTVAATAVSSLGTSFALAAGFSVLAGLAAAAVLDWSAVRTALTTLSIAPVTSLWPSAAIIGVGLGVGLEAIRSMSGYVWRRHDWTLKKLRELTPSKIELDRASKQSLKLYVSGLRVATFTAYLCEMVFQLVALGLVVWAFEAATPDFHLFTNPEAASPWSSILFLGETALDNFRLKEVLGVAWTPLVAAPGVPFSLAMWVFQVVLIGFLVRELWSAWRIKAADVSEDLAAALSR